MNREEVMELIKSRRSVRAYKPEQIKPEELDYVLEENGWLVGSRQDGESGSVELELEDERLNPKYGILAVKNYLQQRAFAPDTTIELAGMPVGIYE